MVGFLKVKGTKIVDNDGPVVLTGTASGGHLNMENFITGYPGHETEHKNVIQRKIGKEKFEFFFDKFYDYFWTASDAKFYKSLGFNCLRIPFNYHHFIDDGGDMFQINPKGFERLDKLVNTCADQGIYTILDLHSVPGGHNQQWHSDNPTHYAMFWEYKIFQDVILNLWKEIALYYKDNHWVAGFNPLNEPATSDTLKLINFYNQVESVIRSVDKNHILYLDGNTYALDFNNFPEKPYPNTVYAIHDYSTYGFPGKTYKGTKEEKLKLKTQYENKIKFMKHHNVPVWNGEWGPVYASEVRGDKDPELVNQARYEVVKDQLEVYKKGDPSGDGSPISWSIWVYKDIGYQGLTYVSPNSKWFKIFGEWLKKKNTLMLDKWGKELNDNDKYYTNLSDHLSQNIPEKYHNVLYPHHYSIYTYLVRVSREMLFSQYCQHEYADLFVGLTFEELDELAASFKIENCLQRDELNAILIKY